MTGRCAHTNTPTNTHTSNERIISAIHFVHLAEINIKNKNKTTELETKIKNSTPDRNQDNATKSTQTQ